MTCTLPGSSTGSQAFNSLVDPSLRCALLQSPAAQAITTGQAAFDLASKVASGQIPTETEITAGLAGIGTVVAGPAGGLIMGAAGAITSAVIDITTFALGAIAQALGLDQQPPPTYSYKGLQRVGLDTIAYSPQDKSNWLPFLRVQDFDWVVSSGSLGWGKYGPNPDLPVGGRPPYSPIAAQANDGWQNWAIATLYQCLYFGMDPVSRWCWDYGSWQNGIFMPADPKFCPDTYTCFSDWYWDGDIHKESGSSVTEVDTSTLCNNVCSWMGTFRYANLPPFEEYMRVLLLSNLRNWANAWPFVPPQKLLSAAVQVWNASHKGSASPDGSVGGKSCGDVAGSRIYTCYMPPTPGVASGCPGRILYVTSGGWPGMFGSPFVSGVMMGQADSSGNMQSLAPTAVNQPNPYFVPARTAVTPGSSYASATTQAFQNKPIRRTSFSGMSAGEKVAIAAAGAVGVTAGGMALYGFLSGQGAGYLFGKTVDAFVGAKMVVGR
jgi:hypothetical protein